MHPVGNIYHVPEFRGHQAFYKRPRRDKSGDPGIGHDIVPDIRNDRVEHLAGISAVFLSEKPVGTAVGICKSEIVIHRGIRQDTPDYPQKLRQVFFAVGVSGVKKSLIYHDNIPIVVGKIVKVEPKIVNDCLEDGYIPVISTVALGIDNDTAYNINADTAAAELAISLGAEKLILLTDVRGVLKDPKDDSTLISQIRLNEVPGLLASGIIGGGMIPKIECCVNALERGVHRTHILDGRIPHSILTEMLSHKGIGTMLWE